MENTDKIIEKISKLSNLEFSEEELTTITPQFEKILEYIAELDQIDLEGVKPMTHVNENTNSLREDKVEESLSLDDALKNAPKHNNIFFKVPKVLD